MPKLLELTLGNGKFHFKPIYSEDEPNKPVQVDITVKKSEGEGVSVLELAEAIYKCFREDDDSFDIEGQTVNCEVDFGEYDFNLEIPTYNMSVDEFVSYVDAQIAL